MHLSNILFLDIETVPQYDSFEKAEETYQKLWEEKARFLLQSDEDTPSSVFERAGIYAEFGKIVCISVGLINDKETTL
ncbi:hypothetical protein N9A49_06460 [Salibacteraceae bacterium]|nr:hypothetical protein [Salibacteraceae bacterium]